MVLNKIFVYVYVYNSGLIGTSKVLKIFVIGRTFRGKSNLKIFKTLRVPINPNCTFWKDDKNP